MKNLFLLMATLLLMAVPSWAAPVDVKSAQAKAHQFLLKQYSSGNLSGSINQLKLAHTQVSALDGITPVYYVFNAASGFVVVSGEDRAREILAYGDQQFTDLKDMPANMKYWLDSYKLQLEFLLQHPELEVEAPSLMDASRTVVNPLITANWSQNAPYWNECPVYGTDTCYTGCPATSLSMVFHYWKYPKQQTPAVPSYTMPSYGVGLPELPPTVFDWDNMLDEYTGGYTPVQATAVAHLMRYIGQAEEMDYTISGSGAYGKDVLRAVKFFEYDQNAQLLFKTDDLGYANYSDAQWADLIQAELEAGRPIVYMAYDNYTGMGHAFNIDGYDGDGNYHINWGWNGRGNGHFALNAFTYGDYTFGTGQQMVIGIQPPEDYQNPRLQAYPNRVDIESYINQSATATISLKGTNLTSGVTLTLNDPDGVFSIDHDALTQAQAEAGMDITVTYAPAAVGSNTATIVCTSDGADAMTITLNGRAPLEIYAPEMQPASDASVTLTSFKAAWTDATPAGNITSYTLEVNPKPSYTLLVEADFSDLPQMSPTNQASHASDYLPEGWTFNGSEFNLEGGCVSMRRNGTITTSALDLKGYDKMTIEVTAKAYGYYGDGSELYVTTSQGTQELVFMYAYETKTLVVDCNETEQVVFKAGYYPMIQDIKIYAGDATRGVSLNASETGDENHRLVEGITSKSYTVKNLTAGGTFLYKVKALYIDGTESDWSNIEMVTLADNGHAFDLGDVNHDGSVTIADVTSLIDYLLGGNNSACPVCADLNGDEQVSIGDVTSLIDMLLSNN